MEMNIANTLDWLSSFGADPGGGVTRLLYTPDWLAAQMALAERMKAAEMNVYYDDAGNLFGRFIGTEEPGRVVLTGSHMDTVKNGGKYDGAYGITAGLLALVHLYETFGPPKRTLEVVSLCEEEGSRFPLAYWGSGNIVGRYKLDQVPEVVDISGISLQKAMKVAGFGLGLYPPPRRHDLAAFIEVHIEQGIVLERENKQIGLVQGIVGQRRYTVTVDGEANHAGTTPMGLRIDALAGVAEMLAYMEEAAFSQGDPLVATAGKLEVEPNVSNVVPGKVTFTVDVRHSEEQLLDQFCSSLFLAFEGIAAHRELRISYEAWVRVTPAHMNAGLTEQLKQICKKLELSYRPMFSGAGHDAQLFQALCPTAMIFVPSRAGISHSPLEFTESAALEDGVKVLVEILYKLGYEGAKP
jgi:allantoate deiminase